MSGRELLRERVSKRYGWDTLQISALIDEPLMREVLGNRISKIRCAVETGTYRGYTAALLSEYAYEVHTFDIERHPTTESLFPWLGIENVVRHVIRDDDEKAAILSGLDFDFAWLDGNHREGLPVDFRLVKRCGRVLFHDYCPGHPPSNERSDVVRFVDSLGVGVVWRQPPFAYWVTP